ncbi:MAG TPA: hypothetical protein VGM33_09760 [Baekduia sp.]|jgi:hypothetical protein
MSMTQTPTATCASCGTTGINGRFCPSCGAPVTAAVPPDAAAAPQGVPVQPPAAPASARSARRPRWLPAALIGATVAAVGVAVAVVLLVVGGNPSDPDAKKAAARPGLRDVTLAAQDVYVPRQGNGFVAFMPTGWTVTKTRLTIPFAGAIVVKSAQDDSQTVTVGALNENTGSLASAAKALRPSLGDDATVTASAATRFAGGRKAWRINYTAGGQTAVAYLFDACHSRYGVVGSSKAASYDTVKARFGLIASSLQPSC